MTTHTQAAPARYRENLPSHGVNRTDISVALTTLRLVPARSRAAGLAPLGRSTARPQA